MKTTSCASFDASRQTKTQQTPNFSTQNPPKLRILITTAHSSSNSAG